MISSTKAAVIDKIARETGIKTKDVETVVNNYLEQQKRTLLENGSVIFTGVATLKTYFRKPRKQFLFGETYDVPEKKAVKVTLSQGLKAKLNP